MLSAFPLWAQEFELGTSIFPIYWESEDVDTGESFIDKETDSFFNDWLVGFHFGFAYSILYASWDSFILPPAVIQDMTTKVRPADPDMPEGEVIEEEGFYRPGFINFFDVGIRIVLFNLVTGFAELGINWLYVYNQADLPDDRKPGSIGANLRLGAGVKITPWFGVLMTATAIFPSFNKMANVLKNLVNQDEAIRNAAARQIKLFPTLLLNFYI
jgi:hypothetical protein